MEVEICSNLFFLLQKLRVFGRWNGYLCGGFKGRPWFQVRKNCTFSRGNVICNVNLGYEKSIESCYKIQKLDRKSSFKVTNSAGEVVAEVGPLKSWVHITLFLFRLSLSYIY